MIKEMSKLGITTECFSDELIAGMKRVWEDKGTKKVYARRNEYYLSDSAA